jgi:soluble lytic murein transglycosylase-like protein
MAGLSFRLDRNMDEKATMVSKPRRKHRKPVNKRDKVLMRSGTSVARAAQIISVVLATFISSEAHAAKKSDVGLCEKHLSAASEAEDVPLGLLYAVALTETGSGGVLSPYALNIEGTPFLASSSAEAMVAFQKAREADKSLIDLGCMQINFRYHHQKFSSIPDMLDPRQNVTYAAKFLKSLKLRHGSWTEAVARYHAGPANKVAQHRYVCKVLTQLVATNFGKWTPESKSYCSQKIE